MLDILDRLLDDVNDDSSTKVDDGFSLGNLFKNMFCLVQTLFILQQNAFYDKLSEIYLTGTYQGFSVVLPWAETGLPGENQLSNLVSMPRIKPRPKWSVASALTTEAAVQSVCLLLNTEDTCNQDHLNTALSHLFKF